jgi:hypothetical protein
MYVSMSKNQNLPQDDDITVGSKLFEDVSRFNYLKQQLGEEITGGTRI